MVTAGQLNVEQRSQLLSLARRALQMRLDGQSAPVTDTGDAQLLQPAGAFVTLRTRGETDEHLRLRGCIGTFEAQDALVDVVTRMAVAAALNDPRFPPVRLGELPEIVIEISVLSPRQRVSAADVRVGTHGLFISRAGMRGVLLPQVAVEQAWDRETFLDQTCRKAGLDAGCWRDEQTVVEAFTAQVFSEA